MSYFYDELSFHGLVSCGSHGNDNKGYKNVVAGQASYRWA